MIDVHRHQGAGSGPVSGETLAEDLSAIRRLLERLVALEEARHARENFLEAALTSDAPAVASAGGPVDLATLDFVRTPERTFLVRENGELRQPTPAEAAALATTVGGGSRDQRERRR